MDHYPSLQNFLFAVWLNHLKCLVLEVTKQNDINFRVESIVHFIVIGQTFYIPQFFDICVIKLYKIGIVNEIKNYTLILFMCKSTK